MGNSHGSRRPKPHIRIGGGRIIKPIRNGFRHGIHVIDNAYHLVTHTIEVSQKQFVDEMNKLSKHPGRVSEKLNLLYNHLDGKTKGVGSLVLLAAVPELALVQASSKAVELIQQGHSPNDALTTVGTSLLTASVLGKELNVLRISKNAFANKAIQQRFMNSKTGKLLKEKLKAKLPKQIANKID